MSRRTRRAVRAGRSAPRDRAAANRLMHVQGVGSGRLGPAARDGASRLEFAHAISCRRDACRRVSAGLTEFSVAVDAQETWRVRHAATVHKDHQQVARTVSNWPPAEGTGFALPAGRTASNADHMPNDTIG